MKEVNLPKLTEEKTSYSLPLYVSVRQELEQLSQKTGISVANLVRHAINELLEESKCS